MIQLFITDLDGTLLNHEKRVEDRDHKALMHLRELGIGRCLASGRLRSEMVRVAERMGGGFHLICQNGAHVETADGRVLLRHTYEGDLARAIYDAFANWDVLTVVCLAERDLIRERSQRAAEVEKRLFAPYTIMPDLAERLGRDVFPTKFSLFGEPDHLDRLQETLREEFAGRIAAYRSDIDCLDVMPGSISKGAGLRVLLSHLDISFADVACVGDSYNDISMFQAVGQSYAMHRADAAVLREAQGVAASVADAVDHLLALHVAGDKEA